MKAVKFGFMALFVVTGLRADQLWITGSARDGAFEKFERGRISFMPEGARKNINPSVTQVSRLTLDTPIKVEILRVGGKEEETAELLGFENRAFRIDKNGVEETLPFGRVESIRRALDFGGVAKKGAGRSYPVPDVDVAALAGLPLDELGQAALKRFIEAKKKFDDFVAENNRLIAEMDSLQGPKRMAMANQLRERMYTELPLRKELVDAHKALPTHVK